jgi:DNA-binding beta-propeller fold protein YncE
MKSSGQLSCGLLFTIQLFAALSGKAQTAKPSDMELARTIERSPTLEFREKQFPLHAPNSNWMFGAVSGVAVSTNGNIYVIQRGTEADPILMFDPKGKFLRSWGKGDFTLPHSLRLDTLGNVWAVDAGASKVMKYSSTGKKLLTISIRPVTDNGSPFRGVTDIAFAPNGRAFISDGYANARILEYTEDGNKVREWGHAGTAQGEFQLPHGIQISQDGTIYVADRENGRIEKFDLKGKFLGEIDGLGRCYALKLDHGALWASVSPMGEDPGSPGWLVKLDPTGGRILGHLNVPDRREGHALDVLASGEPIVTAGNGLLLFEKP